VSLPRVVSLITYSYLLLDHIRLHCHALFTVGLLHCHALLVALDHIVMLCSLSHLDAFEHFTSPVAVLFGCSVWITLVECIICTSLINAFVIGSTRTGVIWQEIDILARHYKI